MNWRLIRRALKQADDIGEFTAAPRPDDSVAGAYHDYTRWVCDSYAQVPDWAKVASGVAGVGWLGVEEVMRRVCSQYLGDGMPSAIPPFSGGQCPVGYLTRVDWTFVSDPNNRRTTGVDTVIPLGPVGGFVRKVHPSAGECWAISHASVPPSQIPNSSVGGIDYRFVQPLLFADNALNPAFNNLRRSDGMPDNCGNPPAKEPTRSPTAPPPPSPSPPNGGEEPIGSPVGPIFRPGPIPSPYNEPDWPFPPVDPFNPGGGGEDSPFFGPGNPEPGYPGIPGAPVPTEPGGGGEGSPDGVAEGEAPEGSELSGLLVEIAAMPPNAKEFSPGVYRGVAYIYMGNEAGLDQDFAGSMLRDGQFVLAEKPGLTHWRVSANTGYSLLVTPYWREVVL